MLRKVKINNHFAVCDINVVYKGVDNPAAVIGGALIGGNQELLQEEKNAVMIQDGRLYVGQAFQLIAEGTFLLLQVGQTGGQAGAAGAVLDGLNDVIDLAANVGQALLQHRTLRCGLIGGCLLGGDNGIGQFRHRVGLQEVVVDGLHHKAFCNVLGEILLFAGAALCFAAAGIIIVYIIAAVVAADPFHQAAALAAVQLTRKQIVGPIGAGGAVVEIACIHFLCPRPKVIVNDGGNSPIDADIIGFADVGAVIGFVLDDAWNAAFVERLALGGAQPGGVELRDDRRRGLPGGVVLEDEADSGRFFLVDDETLVLVGGQAKRAVGIDSLPLERGLPHATPHFLGQLGRVILGQGFHQALQDDAFRPIDRAFGGIEDLHAVVTEPLFVDGGVVAVAGKAVGFPADHKVEKALAAVCDHLLKSRAGIGPTAGDVAVDILMGDGQPAVPGVGFAVAALALDALLGLLGAAAVSVVGNQPSAGRNVFFGFHDFAPCGLSRIVVQ